jgi:hypothetical protein
MSTDGGAGALLADAPRPFKASKSASACLACRLVLLGTLTANPFPDESQQATRLTQPAVSRLQC